MYFNSRINIYNIMDSNDILIAGTPTNRLPFGQTTGEMQRIFLLDHHCSNAVEREVRRSRHHRHRLVIGSRTTIRVYHIQVVGLGRHRTCLCTSAIRLHCQSRCGNPLISNITLIMSNIGLQDCHVTLTNGIVTVFIEIQFHGDFLRNRVIHRRVGTVAASVGYGNDHRDDLLIICTLDAGARHRILRHRCRAATFGVGHHTCRRVVRNHERTVVLSIAHGREFRHRRNHRRCIVLH